MNLADLHFLRPVWLLALLPTLAVIVFLLRQGRGQGDWAKVCDAELLPHILDSTPDTASRQRWPITAIAALLAIVALAGPTFERLPGPAFRNQSALVIALDLSRSMDATDIQPSRISRARFKIADILKQRKDGQTALLVYGGEAFTVTPLTRDTATIASQLEALTTDIMPSPGSNPVLAIKRAVELLKNAGAAEGHIVLVGDGMASADVDAAIGTAGRYPVSVLALGSEAGAPIPLAAGGFLHDADGKLVVARLDVDALSALASASGGMMRIAGNDDSDINQLTAFFEAATAKANTVDGKEPHATLEQWNDLGPWLALLLLPWAALRFRKGLLGLVVLACLPLPRDAAAFDWQTLWQTPNQQAQQAFDAGQYPQAAAQFQDPAWRAAAHYRAGQYPQAAEALKNVQNADGHYNRGNALARSGDLQAALQAYDQALTLEPGHADARYNKELVEKQLQQQQPGQENKSSPEPDEDKPQQDKPGDSSSPNGKPGGNGEPKPDAKPQPGKQDKPADASKTNPLDPEDDEQRPDEVRRRDKASEPGLASSSKNATAAADGQLDAQRKAEPLLKRIPDEPTGLLKRKFRYQYGQRAPPYPDAQTW